MEAREGKGANASVYDLCIKKFGYDDPMDYGENVLIVEITNTSDNTNKAKERIAKAFRKRNSTLQEAFIFNYIDLVWIGYHKDSAGKVVECYENDDVMSCRSFFLNFDFKAAVNSYLKSINCKC